MSKILIWVYFVSLSNAAYSKRVEFWQLTGDFENVYFISRLGSQEILNKMEGIKIEGGLMELTLNETRFNYYLMYCDMSQLISFYEKNEEQFK